ncbi:MAG: 2-amino-4-hydroxy-6-hydroxymethyldihydropteridine diphosphokinase [Sphingobacteriaceae bacterium]
MQTYALYVRAKSLKYVTTMIDIFLLLGSNIGNREVYLKDAADQIFLKLGKVIKYSSVYETQSWGRQDAPDYLNQVIQIQTDKDPEMILNLILQIEKDLGRERKEKYGSRTIDIDILFYGNQIIDLPDLKVPHPELHRRRFTLTPLAEIAPGLMHPVIEKSVLALCKQLKDDLVVKKL